MVNTPNSNFQRLKKLHSDSVKDLQDYVATGEMETYVYGTKKAHVKYLEQQLRKSVENEAKGEN